MRVAIVGAGALGSLFGGILSKHGHDVWLYNPSNVEHIKAIQQNGLCIDTHEGSILVDPHATSEISDIPKPIDLVGIFVKAYDTETAICGAQSLIDNNAWVLSLQNGVGSEEVMVEHLERGRVLRGVTSQGATYLSPGHVLWGGRGPTKIGSLTNLERDEQKELFTLCNTLSEANWESTRVDVIEPLLWEKLLVNVGINSLTALFDVPNGSLISDANLRAIMRGLVAEAHPIAQKHGVERSLDEMIATTERVCEKTGSNISSMLQDVRRGKRTEVEFINGAVVAEAEGLELLTPLNRLVMALIMKR